ncbi:MAG: hypothetical protein JWP76_5500, partial [Dactylosporangium sp.]|nr:hypothetical protein [Dactylosporangium sp.]
RAGGTTSVWLPVSAARGYAALGNSERAMAAIRAAEVAWERVEPDEVDELGGICTFNQPRTLYYAADALAWLPTEADNAESYSARAVDTYSSQQRDYRCQQRRNYRDDQPPTQPRQPCDQDTG